VTEFIPAEVSPVVHTHIADFQRTALQSWQQRRLAPAFSAYSRVRNCVENKTRRAETKVTTIPKMDGL